VITLLLFGCSLQFITNEAHGAESFFEEQTVPQLVKKFPVCCGTQRFSTMFTRASCLSHSWAIPVQSLPPVLFLEHSLQYYSPVYAFDFQVVSFSLIFPSKPCMHLSSHQICHILCPFHSSWYDHHICNNWLGMQFISSLCSLLQSPVTSFLSCPNIFLSTLFSNTLSLCSALTVRNQVSHPYHTTGVGWEPFCISIIFKSLC